MRPCKAFHALEMIVNSSRSSFYRKGVALSSDDSQLVREVYMQWILLFLDLGYLSPEAFERSARRLWSDMIKVDVLDLNNAFTEGLHSIRIQSHKGFKALCSQISTHLYNIIKEDFKKCLTGDVLAAKRLVQLFSYTNRLSLNDIDLTQQMLESYLTIEESLQDSYDDKLTRSLNYILRTWLGSFDPRPIIGQHGPGGISERGRCSIEAKFNLLATDPLLDLYFSDETWNFSHRKLDRTSKTIFVPKSYKTFRTISMEPTALQYYQQGVWRAISDQVRFSLRFDSHYTFTKPRLVPGYLQQHIGFEDQERNRRLAKLGSVNRNYATLDLSAASDSVSYVLVKKLFRGTWLYKYLVSLRSTKTKLPDGRIISLKKFAPMGSALCFPIETLVFAAICEYVTREHGSSGDYSVFGDDIIVPTHCVDHTINILTNLGFKVNLDKSFYHDTCWFRESCGGEYCDGYDVTPLRVSRKYSSLELDVRVDQLISLANSCYERSYRYLRQAFINKLFSLKIPAYFSTTSLLSDNYTNYHAKKRWNTSLQRFEVKVAETTASYSPKEKKKQSDEIRYYYWLQKTHARKNLREPFAPIICRPSVVVHHVWRPLPE